MTLQEYIKTLQNLIEENPRCANMEVFYSSDAEGNWFEEVFVSPGKLWYRGGDAVLNDKDYTIIKEEYPEDVEGYKEIIVIN